MLARLHGIAVDPDLIAHEFCPDCEPFGIDELLLAARQLGLKSKRVSTSVERLPKIPMPALALTHDGKFFLIARTEEGPDGVRILIHDPEKARPETISNDDLVSRWTGELILAAPLDSFPDQQRRFDFTWFIPSIVKYRKLLGEVLLVSFALQFFALVTPLFFQVVMDKVLVHRGFSTLDVIAFGLLVVMLFESVLSWLRTFVFAHTTSRIDVELGAQLFRHLINLPLAYFQARRVGDSVARVRELETIRQFLTGNAITVVLDVVFSVVFLAVMLFYSVKLSLVVIASLPMYVLLSVLVTPVLRSRLQEKFSRGAENQSFLVEVVSGMDTVKSMAVEPHMRRHWDKQLAAYVAASFRSGTLSSLAYEGSNLIGKIVTAATLWLGAHLVISGELSVGQLIAFNMLAGRVAQPIMRLAQLWMDFQQIGISLQRLGDILNIPAEISGARHGLPRLEGRVEFDEVHFRYRPDGQEILRGVNLRIRPGEVVGIVGRSGSGKSTIARLVQRLFVPERGRVLIDGVDLAMIDPASLRRQIGVVLQENTLFNRTIRDNVALADPGVQLERVIQAARLAGAHDFIMELPQGYDTVVEEHGANLSGGQRQRIAIARALVTNPRVLIFDEATSALDYESELHIQQNMKTICQGRTVIIIAHRLSTIRGCDRIVVIDRGQIVEEGSHTELMAHQAGHYNRLHRIQAA